MLETPVGGCIANAVWSTVAKQMGRLQYCKALTKHVTANSSKAVAIKAQAKRKGQLQTAPAAIELNVVRSNEPGDVRSIMTDDQRPCQTNVADRAFHKRINPQFWKWAQFLCPKQKYYFAYRALLLFASPRPSIPRVALFRFLEYLCKPCDNT